MSLSRFAFAAVAATLFVSPVSAADAPAGAPMAGHGMMGGMFTKEERMMWFADGMKATANMTDDQKQAYRKQQRQQFMAMSDADRAKYKADLDTRWAALPPDQKAAIQQRMQDFMAKRAQGDGGGQ